MGSSPGRRRRRFEDRHEKSWSGIMLALGSVLAGVITVGCHEFLGLTKLEQSLQVLSSSVTSFDVPAVVKCDPVHSAAGTAMNISPVRIGTGEPLQEPSRQDLYTGTSSRRMVQLGSNSSQLRQVSKASAAKGLPAWLDGVEEWEGKQCIPINKWQLPRYGPSTCNLMHEMDMTRHDNHLEMINCGSSRCAFRIDDDGNNGDAAVLKMTRIEKGEGYSDENYEDAWRDAIAMERMTASPFVLNAYGSCGASQLTEVGGGGNVHDLVKLARLAHKRKTGDWMNAEKRLRVGYHVASGLAAMHSIDETPSLVHNDLCCHQYILVDGVYKLNDFHLASLNLINKETGQACKEPKWSPSGKYVKLRPPEEVQARSVKVERDKSDVWLMGNILYYLLTKQWIFEGRLNREAIKLVLKGKRSEYPSHLQNSTDPADQAMMKAIEMAWTQDPRERPPAKEIAKNMRKQLIEINGRDDSPWRVAVPPLPPNYRYTTSDWYTNYKLDPNRKK